MQMLKTGPKLLFRFAVLLVVACLLLVCETAFAVTDVQGYLWSLTDSETNKYVPGARWKIGETGTWLESGDTETNHANGSFVILFNSVDGYYSPPPVTEDLAGGTMIITNWYRPWTNMIGVTLIDERTNSVPVQSAEWSLTTYTNTFTNSSSFSEFVNGTGDHASVYCPTGTYVVTWSDYFGYTTPDPETNTIAGPDSYVFTGTYTRACGDITNIVTPATGNWEYITSPPDYSTYTASPKTGTNTSEMTNAPIGLYVIHYIDNVPFYSAPDDVSFTNSVSGITISRAYSPLSGNITNIVTPTNGNWVYTTYPTNYFDYTESLLWGTNTSLMTNAPIGYYVIHYNDVPYYSAPDDVHFTNSVSLITISNDYSAMSGNITNSVFPIDGSWIYTNYPSGYTNYTESLLWGTNTYVMTNAPIGSYRIHYIDNLPGYSAPDDVTFTNTTSGFGIHRDYSPLEGEDCTLIVTLLCTNPPPPMEVPGAQWKSLSQDIWRNSGASETVLYENWVTIYCKDIDNYYTPSDIDAFQIKYATVSTNYFYTEWTNDFSVTLIDERSNTLQYVEFGPPKWGLSFSPPTFSNHTSGTGNQPTIDCPTGSYTIVYSNLTGYNAPSLETIDVDVLGTDAAAFTGIYTRIRGDIIIDIQNVTNGTWEFKTYPTIPIDITNYTSDALSGTNDGVITNAPSGTYEIQYGPPEGIPGYNTPPNETKVVEGTYTFIGAYGRGPALTIHIYEPGELVEDVYLGGIGWGTYTNLDAAAGYFNGVETWYYTSNSFVTITAYPTNGWILGATTNAYDSFFYEWAGDIGGAITSSARSLGLTMDQDRSITLLFSREYETYDNVGDLDHDRLPEEWEDRWELDPKSNSGSDGQYGNSDGDFIPSYLVNPPTVYSTANYISSYLGTNSTTPGYPLIESALSNGYHNIDTERGAVKFNNELECRGLDGYYLTNGPLGGVFDDCPRTDPTLADTDDDGMNDGWEYYFWYWRSADSYAAGFTNTSANLDWVNISPCDARQGGGTLGEHDTDGDTFFDVAEYILGTDPTHADSDGDGMDDYWENNQTVCNPLYPGEGSGNPDRDNPDRDYYASSTVSLLTTGMVGTAFSDDSVYHVGTNIAVWVDVYTNSGAGLFDLYKDTVIIASSPITNQQTGTVYAFTVYYGTSSGLTMYKSGYPVWVDTDSGGTYSSNDIALVNPAHKHDLLYLAPPSAPFPGVTSFDPRTAWYSPGGEHPNTSPFITLQEYYGGDYLGRVSWDGGGLVIAENDDADFPTRNSSTDPGSADTDADQIQDGWELYVGLDPLDDDDAVLDPDEDKLLNWEEFANAGITNVIYAYTNETATNSVSWATDPGVLVAPAPNDPHPADTDWDGAMDGKEVAAGCNPTTYDTDADYMPDGWELYAGTDPVRGDTWHDPDGDGLINVYEFYTGMIDEWQFCDPAWRVQFTIVFTNFTFTFESKIDFDARYGMSWDARCEKFSYHFMSPDFLTDPSFMYVNGVETNIAVLRANYPAASAITLPEGGLANFHSTLANETDSDNDGMDDYWEFFHGMNPCKGRYNLMLDLEERESWTYEPVLGVDADPISPGFQVGTDGTPYTNLNMFITAYRADPGIFGILDEMVGPFNFSQELMDPDGDGLPNIDEYSYSSGSTTSRLYHTDPTPFWRTDETSTNSIPYQLFNQGYHVMCYQTTYRYSSQGDIMDVDFWKFDAVDGFDTDNDGVGDFAEINSSAGQNGSDPLDSRNPVRNRALYVDGTNDFVRTISAWGSYTAWPWFCVEAWIKPDNPTLMANQVIVEKAALYETPYDTNALIVRAHFRLGITNGLPYILYNGKGAMTTYQATAHVEHRLQSDVWTHVAGVYDGVNLTIYVNGEESSSIYSTEIPATGEGEEGTEGRWTLRHPQTLMVGARDLTSGQSIAGTTNDVQAADYFGGYIDEVRVWRSYRTIGEIQAAKDRRLTWSEVEDSSLYSYYTFDDVPDPDTEGIVPEGMATLDTTLSFHPVVLWWNDYALHSRVYTGSVGQAYNYIVTAEDHRSHIARIPPRDDYINFTNVTDTLPDDYNNPSDPYDIFKDLYFFMDAKAVAASSWLATLDPDDPDSTDSDGDGLPDTWEVANNLDPNDATGDNGAWGDYDNDGLNNRAEYLAGTNPRISDTDGDGISDYDSCSGPGTQTWGEMYSDGDGMPDTWEQDYGLDPYMYDAHLDLDEDGWSNYAEYQDGTDPSNASSYPAPAISGAISYYGTESGTLIILGYQTNTMDGTPAATASSSVSTNFTITGFEEGDVYLFAFVDVNGDGTWDGTEPCGVAEDQPIDLSWTSMDGVILGISDESPGYGRFAWPSVTSTGEVQVLINRISEEGSPSVLARSVRLPRYYFHEWDYQLSGIYGLTSGTYQWWVDTHNGVFSVNWPGTRSTPTLVFPRGDTINYARIRIGWTMDEYSTTYHLFLFNANAVVYINNYFVAPDRDSDGVYWDYLPYYANELGNGTYYWCVTGYNPEGESEWSELQSFTVDLSSDNSRWITGDIYYFGKAGATNIIVEAFDNAGFSGDPDARIIYAPTCTTNSLKTSFTLLGLQAKTYYLRAFADISPGDNSGRNNVLDWWESEGFVRNDTNAYQPQPLVLTNSFYIEDTTIVIRDKDTDNDELPDAWEMHYFGNLDQTGAMDYDDDGESNLDEYMIEPLDTDPTNWDTDGDGLSDHFEVIYDGSDSYDPYNFVSNPSGGDLNPVLWDTDEDAYSDGAEIRRYHTDPLDPSSYPWYRPLCYDSFASPSDYDGDGRSDFGVYDSASGTWYILTWAGQFWDLLFGYSTTQPLLGDYDGDGFADFAVYDLSSGTWYIYTWTGEFVTLLFGFPETIPVPADYDRDGRTDFAVYYPETGYWYIYTWQAEFTALQFGSLAMIPVPGDYDADGKSDLAVFEPDTGYWYIYTWNAEFYMIQFGNSAMIPVPGDYDGDGKSDFAVFEPATGYWYIVSWTGDFFYGQFGWSDVVPVPGDYDGDGRTDFAVYYPAAGYWYIYTWTDQFYQAQFGWSAAAPVLTGR